MPGGLVSHGPGKSIRRRALKPLKLQPQTLNSRTSKACPQYQNPAPAPDKIFVRLWGLHCLGPDYLEPWILSELAIPASKKTYAGSMVAAAESPMLILQRSAHHVDEPVLLPFTIIQIAHALFVLVLSRNRGLILTSLNPKPKLNPEASPRTKIGNREVPKTALSCQMAAQCLCTGTFGLPSSAEVSRLGSIRPL